MIQPLEAKQDLAVSLSNGVRSTAGKVWDVLTASRDGNLQRVQQLVNECAELAYAQYNYTPPIHFAVREGHAELVQYLLGLGALDPSYITYPFKETLLTVAQDRGYRAIAGMLQQYLSDPSLCKFKGDNGEIHYNQTPVQQAFQKAVDKGDICTTAALLLDHADLLQTDNYFWGEGILMMPAKDPNPEMVKLLLDHGAKVPGVSKWGRFYYFKHYPMAVFLMQHGMNPNHMNWHHVTLLHDMAQEGDLQKARLLLQHGADVDPLEEEYCSTPLGMAARWGHVEMVELLLQQGADVHTAGVDWATPLQWAKRKGHERIEAMLREAGAEH
ncbi:MAG TPA: ankyrin repeat domain-containing protein [Chitinophagaceae bacterium]|nr:ankyrin repeat domain-containing protein [Chitinophagaceae bacterium]